MFRFFVIAFTIAASLAATPPAAAQQDPRERRRTPIVEVFEHCRDAVVNISTTRVIQMRSLGFGWRLDDVFDFGQPGLRNRQVESVGSGVLVHEDGYIVTNAHVVSQASDVQVTFADQVTLPADVVAVDAEHDLAVLKVQAPRPLAHVKLGRSNDIMVGETVVAIGNPLGLQHTVTRGIVSALGRDLYFSHGIVHRGLIQTDAPINPGNSGGPLLNINSELIGINTAIRGDAENIGFAIPVDQLWEQLPALLDIERRQRVSFGLQVSGRDPEIVVVRPDTPAAEAGLQPGDRILRINGEEVRDGIDYYVHLLAQQPGSAVELVLQRGEKTVKASVPLKAIPLPDGRNLAQRVLGVDLEHISDSLRRRYSLPDYARLAVADVQSGGPADLAGIQRLDFILRIDNVPVASLQDVGLALEQIPAGRRIHIQGWRLDASRPYLWTTTVEVRGRED